MTKKSIVLYITTSVFSNTLQRPKPSLTDEGKAGRGGKGHKAQIRSIQILNELINDA